MNVKSLLGIAAIACVFAVVNPVGAAIVGPTYPAPGGNSWASNGGSAVHAGGVDFAYTNFDPSAFTDLYWGAWDVTTTSATLDGVLRTLAFDGVSGNVATWRGTTNWLDHLTGAWHDNVPIQLDIAITGNGSWVAAADLGLIGRSDYLWDTSRGNDFTANFLFSADAGVNHGGLKPLDEFEVGASTSPNMQSNFSGGFFATAAPSVPEPAAVVVWLLLGILSFVFCRSRRK